MIAIDTNILLRYILRDDEKQANLASKIINKYMGKKASILINNVVLCEFIWSLKMKKFQKTEISGLLKEILVTEEFSFEDTNLLLECLGEFEQQNCDFADIVIAKFNHQKYEYIPTVTFDKKAASLKECKLAE